MVYPTYVYTFPITYIIDDIFNTKKLGLQNKVCKYILTPSIEYYNIKYQNDYNIFKLLQIYTCDRYGYSIEIISTDYLEIEIYKKNMEITIHTQLFDRELISDLIYLYTHKYFKYSKYKNFEYSLDLLPLSKCIPNTNNYIHIENWMRYMDIPV